MKLFDLKTIGIILLAVIFLKVALPANNETATAQVTTSYDDFIEKVELEEVTQVIFQGNNIIYSGSDNKPMKTRMPVTGDQDLLNELLKNDVTVRDMEPAKQGILGQFLLSLFPMVIFIVFLYVMMNRQQGGGAGMKDPTALGKRTDFEKSANPVLFKDVAGCDEAKHEVQEIVDFLKNPQKYWALGAEIPHGVLMQGPPGNGKTLLARAVAGEAEVPFISISGSDFVEKYVGVGAARVRELFQKAKENAPCIIFIDEIDAMGKQRGQGGQGGNDEREQTLNQMLVEMDGFGSQDAVIVIAATNRSDILDEALKRPGRFDRQVHVGLPDVRGREAILKVHAAKKRVTQEIDYKTISQNTAGFSGADLANLVNEAAIISVRQNKEVIDNVSFEDAKDKIVMGNARNGFVMKEKEKSLTAYHEAGHAIVGHLMKQKGLHDPVYKVSIIPRERALGVTVYLPEEDKYSLNKAEAQARIRTLLGGRIAEELVNDEFKEGITTGASNDIERATSYATKMVTLWGMSDIGKGIRQLAQTDAHAPKPLVSGKTEDLIDEEIDNILKTCYDEAYEMLRSHGAQLELMHDALMVRETITQDDVQLIMEGKELETYDNYEESFKSKTRTYDKIEKPTAKLLEE